MKVICKNNDLFFTSLNGMALRPHLLTLNKSYDVISSIQRIQMNQQLALGLSEYNTFYFILCDDNKIRELISTRFVTLEVHREEMLNKILK
jgi:hypothetical protein